MKTLQKLILPILVIGVAVIIYLFYFTDKGLGSFTDFDPNNNANKDIVVNVVRDKGINQQGETTTFYVTDKNGQEVLVQAPAQLPADFQEAERIILRGHLHKEYFHAAEILLK